MARRACFKCGNWHLSLFAKQWREFTINSFIPISKNHPGANNFISISFILFFFFFYQCRPVAWRKPPPPSPPIFCVCIYSYRSSFFPALHSSFRFLFICYVFWLIDSFVCLFFLFAEDKKKKKKKYSSVFSLSLFRALIFVTENKKYHHMIIWWIMNRRQMGEEKWRRGVFLV